MRPHLLSLLLVVAAACDAATPKKPDPKAERKAPAAAPADDDPAVPVEMCRLVGSGIDKVNLWERPTPKDASGLVDRGAVRGHAYPGERVSVTFQTSTSYYVDSGTDSGWVSKSLVPSPCPQE